MTIQARYIQYIQTFKYRQLHTSYTARDIYLYVTKTRDLYLMLHVL